MKTIFTTLAISSAAFLYAQQSAPSVEWTRDYKINHTSSEALCLDNNNVMTFMAKDNDGSSEKLHLVKINAGGVTSDVILSIPAGSYYPWKLVATSDNAFVTTNENDGTLQKYNSAGGLVWNKTFGTDFYTDDFIRTTDSNLTVIGGNFDAGNVFYMIRKMDNNGNTIWEKKAEKLNSMYYEPTAVTQTSDGGYIIGGVYTDNLQSEYMLGYNLVRLDSNGNVIWEKRYAIPANVECWPEKILVSNDGGFVMLSELDDDNPGSNSNSQYGKFDSNGNLIWNKLTPEYISDIEKGLEDGYVLSIIEDDSSNPAIDEFILRKIDELSNLIWEKNYGTLGDSPSQSLIRISDGFAALTTVYGEGGQGNSAKVTKFGAGTAGTSDIVKLKMTLYPNPTTDYLNLKMDNLKSIDKIEIYDASGRLVKSMTGQKSLNINVTDLKKGNYMLKVKIEDNNHTASFIKK